MIADKEDVLSPIKALMHGPQRAAFDDAITFLREEEANFAEVSAVEVQPLRDLASSTHPYRGNAVPKAKAAVANLRGILADLLKAERDRALDIVDTQSARLSAIEDFAALNEANRTQVLAPTVEASAAITSARFVTGIRDRLQRYLTQDYPSQLALLARLAVPPSKTGGQPDKKTPPVCYTPATSLRAQCDLPFIATEADLDQWLAALRIAARAELKKGNRISL